MNELFERAVYSLEEIVCGIGTGEVPIRLEFELSTSEVQLSVGFQSRIN